MDSNDIEQNQQQKTTTRTTSVVVGDTNKNHTKTTYMTTATATATATASPSTGGGCCCKNGRLQTEWKISFFDTMDSPPTTGNGGHHHIINLQKSFCCDEKEPTKLLVVLCKFVIWGFICSTLIYSWLDNKYPKFYLAYATHWSLVMATFYQTLSFLLTTTTTTTTCNKYINNNKRNVMIKITWISYEVAIMFQLLVVILFWILEYNPISYDIDYINLMTHGIVLLLIFIDGLIINRIPIRLKHFIFPFLFVIAYITWTILQSLVLERNPYCDDDNNNTIETNNNNNDTDDEEEDCLALYDIVQWRNNPIQTLIVLVLVAFVAFPILYLLIWSISLLFQRQYEQEDVPIVNLGNEKYHQQKDEEDVDQSHTFACDE